MTAPWLHVIGIGEDGIDGLSPAARRVLDAAPVLFGGARHLAMLPAYTGQRRIAWPSPLADGIAQVLALRTTPA